MHSPLAIRLLTMADLEVAADHDARHMAESGRDGDVIFAPRSESNREAFVDFRLQGWPAPVGEPNWERMWGLFDGQQMVGHANLCGGFLTAQSHRCRLGMGMERPHRGQGNGRRLLQTVVHWARAQPPLAWIDLGVFADNVPAQRLYRRMGFVENGRIEDCFRVLGQQVDDIQMCLRL